jgi:hypothetical protein|nr:MAG TPA: hypothetical protein [Caudoviricetes sp.]
MGEKEELKRFFTCNGEVIEEIAGISISDGSVIEAGILHRNEDGTLCSTGKPLSIKFECKLSNELFWTLVAPNRINQNNFRKMHGIPKRRKINGSRKNKRLSRMDDASTTGTCQRNCWLCKSTSMRVYDKKLTPISVLGKSRQWF